MVKLTADSGHSIYVDPEDVTAITVGGTGITGVWLRQAGPQLVAGDVDRVAELLGKVATQKYEANA